MRGWTLVQGMAGALLLGCTALGGAQAQNLPAGMEGLRGRVWNGAECCGWTWDWTIQSGPRFRGSFRNPNGQRIEEENILVSIVDNRVQITRGGGSGAGGCTYEGTIRPGVAEGTYACNGAPAGRWSARISQASVNR